MKNHDWILKRWNILFKGLVLHKNENTTSMSAIVVKTSAAVFAQFIQAEVENLVILKSRYTHDHNVMTAIATLWCSEVPTTYLSTQFFFLLHNLQAGFLVLWRWGEKGVRAWSQVSGIWMPPLVPPMAPQSAWRENERRKILKRRTLKKWQTAVNACLSEIFLDKIVWKLCGKTWAQNIVPSRVFWNEQVLKKLII